MQEHEDGVMESESIIVEAKVKTSQQPMNSVALNCSVCKKSFRFASALIAHQVIHTGERPYVCSLCGRCFSFRQSLDRHRRTQGWPDFNCLICGETFQSLSACMEHKKSHMGPVVYQCWESAIVRHLKIHMQPSEVGPAELTKIIKLEQEDAENLETVGELSDETEAALQDEGKSNHSLLEGQGQSGSSSSPEPSVLGTGVMQKRKGKATTPKTIRTLISLERSEPLAVKSEEDFYGFPTASREDRDTGVSTGTRYMSSSTLNDRALGGTDWVKPGSTIVQTVTKFQSLERHKQTHKNGRKYECPICGQNFKSLSANTEHTKSHMENGVYRCSDCDRTFSWKSALVRHLRIHTENAAGTERPHKCPRCDLAFSSIRYLNRHLVTHQEERLHVCTCGKAFAYKTALTAHQRTHLKERPHQCKQCGKGFLYKGGLVSHMKIHSDEMPFMCSFCGKSFKMERNMKKHESSHNRENLYSCSQCDKTFVYKATLTRHELTHTGSGLSYAPNVARASSPMPELLKHERYPHGPQAFPVLALWEEVYPVLLPDHSPALPHRLRPYSCTDCDKRFLSANRLKRHTRTHTGEKPYVCLVCGKGFRQSDHLKSHQRTH
ncbi:hypothetical protein DPEC_G00116130 [Dallia pectoralis]|uniref:Uncharacterized protein n=1 Tax=Dallia pectoralis TaxID=75939 RepID=A0ACC2GU44_DALPE|nr:hypothetical protein DPEC_G00116130 [Dallia pectoralis]